MQQGQHELFASIRIPRNYSLFAALTSGRTATDVPVNSKGLPMPLSFQTLYEEEGNLIEIDGEKYAKLGSDVYCRHQDVKKLIATNRFKQIDECHLGGEIMQANWLTLAEAKSIYAAHLATHEPPSTPFQATVEVMRQLPNARLIVWLTP